MRLFFLFILTAALSLTVAQDTQKLRLPATSIPRFSIPQMETPPVNHGDAKVCIWNGDLTGVLSFGIDGNYGGIDDGIWKSDHDYWMAVMDTFGLCMTFYVIGNAPEPGGPGSWTIWDSVRALYAAGHSVQSHTMYHLDGNHNYYEEYKLAKDKLEQEMPYDICHVVGYAGGAIPNDVDSASLWYHGGRGLAGFVNRADRMRYMDTGNAGWGYNYANVKAVCGLDPARISEKYGFVTALTHNIPPSERLARWEDWKYFKSLEHVLWVAGHEEVIQYGQERDTHTLTVNSVTVDVITFTLTDSMNDSVFAYPLTVKVRLNDNWSELTAIQNGTNLWYGMYVKDGKKYALVKAIPDKGEVTLTRTTATVTADPVFVPKSDTYEDSVLVTIYSITDSATIYYTTDGSTPTTSSTKYTGPFQQYQSSTIKAIATHTSLPSSRVTSATYTVVVDSIPPVLDAVAAGGKDTEAVLSFDGPVIQATAENIAHYSIDNGVAVSAASLQADNRTVVLTVSTLSTGTQYTLTVNNITDVKNNIIAANTQKSFTFIPAVIETGLTGYWNFDEATEAHFCLDLTGNGNIGVFHGGTVRQDDRMGRALFFDGEEANVNLGSSRWDIHTTNEYAISFWMKYVEWGGVWITRGVQPFIVQSHYSGQRIYSTIRTANTERISGTTNMAADVWNHIVVTFADTIYRFYLNGQLEKEHTTMGPTLSLNSTAQTILGQSFHGWLDDVCIYNRGLSAADVQTLFADSTGTIAITEPIAPAITNGPPVQVLPNPLSRNSARLLPGTVYNLDGVLVLPGHIRCGVYLWDDGKVLRKVLVTE